MRFYVLLAMAAAACLATGCGQRESAAPASGPAASAGSNAPASVASAGPAAVTNTDLLARVHFSGTVALLDDAGTSAKFREISSLPESAALEEKVLLKLSVAPYHFFLEKRRLPERASDYAAEFRPLLEDMLHSESYLELLGPTNPVPEVLLAVKLSDERAGLWDTNLSQIFSAWSGSGVTPLEDGGFKGWELKKHHAPNVFHFFRARDWVVLAWGDDAIPDQGRWLKNLKQTGRPPAEFEKGNWLEAWADWPRLLAGRVDEDVSRYPRMQLTLKQELDSKGTPNVMTRAVLDFAQPLNVALMPWNVPTNLVHNPMSSFTAIRGIAPLLGKVEFFQRLNLQPMPDQLYMWSMANNPFELRLAAPVPDGPAYEQQYGDAFISQANAALAEHHWGTVGWDESHDHVAWNVPFPILVPRLSATSGTNGNFVLISMLPQSGPQTAMPLALASELQGEANLLYYDWEFTGKRLSEVRNFLVFAGLLSHEQMVGLDDTAPKWLAAIANKLGNSVTEATLAQPGEIVVERKSPLGLSAWELALLGRWETAPGFPWSARYEKLDVPPRGNGASAKGPTSNPAGRNAPSAMVKPSANPGIH
jgi:hypothetical protein